MSDINFLETNAGDIYDTIIDGLEESCSEELFPGDERRIFGEGLAAVMIAAYNYINDTCRQRLLRYARGTVLDALGENNFVTREEAVKAQTTLRFSIDTAIEQNIIIPAGTRATSDFTRYFATDSTVVLPAGSTYIDAAAHATEGGSISNDITTGKINQLVDQVAYIDSVSNTVTSFGGADEETDDAYRERIRLSSSNLSGGTKSYYKYHALSADPSITDAYISNPSGGVVKIVPICAGGEIPSQTLLNKVLAVCSADEVRNLTDSIQVAAPTTVPFDIELTYYVSSEDESKAIETIEGDGGSIDQYIYWQSSTLGRDINPDELRKLILAPTVDGAVGAHRLTVISPTQTTVAADKVAKFSGNLTVTHVVEDE